eukprot:TRINITY_DN42513_c0_g1_i1.p1 TRINITY_DN42513_c0_g1~~TRINITY_DN42513_c0_g1_i1.p1  ORF type:complete len:673 (-),score=154.96 TRINITY_DN42513_c0_g1_i1:47-2065(-)
MTDFAGCVDASIGGRSELVAALRARLSLPDEGENPLPPGHPMPSDGAQILAGSHQAALAQPRLPSHTAPMTPHPEASPLPEMLPQHDGSGDILPGLSNVLSQLDSGLDQREKLIHALKRQLSKSSALPKTSHWSSQVPSSPEQGGSHGQDSSQPSPLSQEPVPLLQEHVQPQTALPPPTQMQLVPAVDVGTPPPQMQQPAPAFHVAPALPTPVFGSNLPAAFQPTAALGGLGTSATLAPVPAVADIPAPVAEMLPPEKRRRLDPCAPGDDNVVVGDVAASTAGACSVEGGLGGVGSFGGVRQMPPVAPLTVTMLQAPSGTLPSAPAVVTQAPGGQVALACGGVSTIDGEEAALAARKAEMLRGLQAAEAARGMEVTSTFEPVPPSQTVLMPTTSAMASQPPPLTVGSGTTLATVPLPPPGVNVCADVGTVSPGAAVIPLPSPAPPTLPMSGSSPSPMTAPVSTLPPALGSSLPANVSGSVGGSIPLLPGAPPTPPPPAAGASPEEMEAYRLQCWKQWFEYRQIWQKYANKRSQGLVSGAGGGNGGKGVGGSSSVVQQGGKAATTVPQQTQHQQQQRHQQLLGQLAGQLGSAQAAAIVEQLQATGCGRGVARPPSTIVHHFRPIASTSRPPPFAGNTGVASRLPQIRPGGCQARGHAQASQIEEDIHSKLMGL